MNAIDIETLNQLISRNDISGNDKVRWLTEFIDGRELQLIQDEFYTEEEVIAIVEKSRATGLTAEYLIEQSKKK